jgi:hypothetical protein
MTSIKVHAVAVALLLGTAVLGTGTLLMTAPAYAAVRAEVGNPLNAALAAAKAKDFKAAMDDVDKANAVSNKTAEETSMINQVKSYVGQLSGDISLGGATAGRNKLASDYAAKNYAGVIADGEALQKAGALDGPTGTYVTQAYYLSGNKAGCIKYVKALGATAEEVALQTEMKCAFDTNDDATQRDALEQLIAKTGKAEYWTDMFKIAEAAKNLTDHQSLDIYRLKFLTNVMAGKDDYINMAQLDLQLAFPAEGSTVLDKGMAAGLLNDDRSKKLQALAKQNSATVASGMTAALAAANKDPGGDALIKIAEQQWSSGAGKDAVATAKSGTAKPLKDKDQAAIVLGLAQISAGQSADAVKTLNADKGDGNGPMIAHLYALYAAHSTGSASASAEPAAATKKKK